MLSLACLIDVAGICPELLQAVALRLPSMQLDLLLARVVLPRVLRSYSSSE